VVGQGAHGVGPVHGSSQNPDPDPHWFGYLYPDPHRDKKTGSGSPQH
jgi:hypothetical protein